jgi:hypothetical protein
MTSVGHDVVMLRSIGKWSSQSHDILTISKSLRGYSGFWGRGSREVLMLGSNKPYHQNGIENSLGRPMFRFSVAPILTEI